MVFGEEGPSEKVRSDGEGCQSQVCTVAELLNVLIMDFEVGRILTFDAVTSALDLLSYIPAMVMRSWRWWMCGIKSRDAVNGMMELYCVLIVPLVIGLA